MNRKRFFLVLGGALWACLGIFVTFVSAAPYKIGIVRNPGQYTQAIRDGFMGHLTGVLGKENLIFKDRQGFAPEAASADNIAIAREFVAWGADMLVTIGSSTSHAVGKHFKGGDIPILFMGITDPVGGGLIPEMNRPGGENITGVTFPIPVHRKIETLRKVFPAAKVYGFVYDGKLPPDAQYLKWIRKYARENEKPVIRFLNTDKEKGIPKEDLTAADLFFGWYSVHLYKYAEKYPGTPFVGATLQGCKEGAIISIYPKLPELGAEGADMAAKILKGNTKPGDIPARNPKHYGICFNLKKAGELEIKIPKGLLDLADSLIE